MTTMHAGPRPRVLSLLAAALLLTAAAAGPRRGGRRRRRARSRAPAPAAAAAQAAAAADGAAPGHQRLRHARHGLPDGAERPGLVRRRAADQAARLPERVRRRRPLLRGRPPEPAQRAGVRAHRRGRAEDHLRVRALRHRRGRGTDDLPPPPRLGRAGPGRRRPDLEPVHGPRRLPELRRVLGPHRHGVLPQRAAALDAVAGRRLALRGRPRAAGRFRRPGRLRRPHRAAGRPGPLPAARPLRAVPAGPGTGATSRRPASCGR